MICILAIGCYYGTAGTIETAKAKLHLNEAVDAGDPLAKTIPGALSRYRRVSDSAKDPARAQQLAREVITARWQAVGESGK